MDNNEKTLEELKKELEEAKNIFMAIQATVDQKEAEEERQRKEKLAKEKDIRYAEIQTLEKQLIKLRSEFVKDYGSYDTIRTYSSSSRDIPEYLKWIFEEV